MAAEPKIACLGKITAKAVRDFGWSVQKNMSDSQNLLVTMQGPVSDIQDFEHLVQSLCEINSQISDIKYE